MISLIAKLSALVFGLALILPAPAFAQAAAQSMRSFKAEPGAWPAGTWETYKSKYLMPEGRIVDDGNGSISHTEGQGYGMLLAVLADDAGTFNRLWGWTKRELYTRPDGLASWKWEPDKTPRVTDPNNASDGDLLIAWALAEAADRWSRPEFAQEAKRIVEAMDKVNGARSAFGRVLMPGAVGFAASDRDDGPVVNLSYWVFPAFETLKKIAPAIDWTGYHSSGLALLRHARFGQQKLPSEWISIAKGKAAMAETFPPSFSYNAVRIPLYLAWGGIRGHEQLGPFIALQLASGRRIREFDLKTSQFGEGMSEPGYQAIFALAECAVNQSPIPYGLRSVSFDRYYPATLHMLSLAAVRLRYAECL